MYHYCINNEKKARHGGLSKVGLLLSRAYQDRPSNWLLDMHDNWVKGRI